jgi:UDPglucose 6-dehydrogenase
MALDTSGSHEIRNVIDMTTAHPAMPALSVIGLGKLGSPMAAVFASKGFNVVGLDLNADFVDRLNAGQAPVVEPQLQELIDANRERLRATTDWNDAVHSTDISFIIVPTPSGPDARFSNRYMVAALEQIGAALRGADKYHLVVVTSTVMPGSTEGELKACLEQASGRKVGEDVGLCYNPEFIALGSVVRDMLHPDMILIGQSDDRAGELLESVYRRSTNSSPEFHRMNLVNAELCKISVNTFVTTKISYANMIGAICDHLPGADADIVTRAVGADSRIGRKYLKPAIGYGGPCFPRDNKAFSALGRSLGVNTALAEATDEINQYQVQRLLGAIEARAKPGATVAVLGLSYKPHTGVVEESQGVQLAGELAQLGYRVVVSDPLALPAAEAMLGAAASVSFEPDLRAAIGVADVVVFTTAWPEFSAIPLETFAREGERRVVIDPWSLFDIEAMGQVADLMKPGLGNSMQLRRQEAA